MLIVDDVRFEKGGKFRTMQFYGEDDRFVCLLLHVNDLPVVSLTKL